MDCELVYIGETGRTMQKRVTEHKTAVRKYDNGRYLVWTVSSVHRRDREDDAEESDRT